MTTPVSIVIPAYNEVEYCLECVDSIVENTAYPYKLILVDNGSTDGAGEYFDSVPGATVVHTGANLGFPAGVNRGLAHAEGHVLLLNSDTRVPAEWLARLVHVLERNASIGLLGPMTNYVSGPQLIDGLALTAMDHINAFARERWETWNGQVAEVERLVGFCLLIRDAAFRRIGLLDERFGLGNFEDDDYCLRARQAGYRTCMALGCFVFHYGSRTFRSMGYAAQKYNELIDENETIFREKWNLDEDGTGHAEQIAARLTREARAAAEAGDLAGALRAFKEAISTCPIYDSAYSNLGAVLWGLGQRERAYEYFRRAHALNPNNEEALQNLRDAATALGKEAPEEKRP
ncbi:MAG: glycosyltransferase [Candidatus Hydrogenedentes bacterium]|nr:glycosyltransferase [Candidatus Hydrogenedentota bacterium]